MFYKEKLGMLLSFLPKLHILRLTIFQSRILDDVAEETATKLKQTNNVSFVLLSQNKLLCYQTCDKSINKIISSNPTNTVTDIQITDCHIADAYALKVIFDKCLSQLQSIDLSRSLIKDKGCLSLSTCLTSKKLFLHFKVLNLTSNYLTSSSVDTLVNILHYCTIEKLIITHNNLYSKKLHNAILSKIQPNCTIRNFNCEIPLTVINNAKNCCGDFCQSRDCKKFAYVYFVNSTITERTIDICNDLSSQDKTFIHKVIFCKNYVKSNHQLSISLDQHQLVKMDSVYGADHLEGNVKESSTIIQNRPKANEECCILLYKSRLLSFRMLYSQTIKVLRQVLLDKVNLDTLQFINCTIPSAAELSQLGNIISISKKQWKYIDISGCNIGDQGCSTLSRMCKEYTKIGAVTIKVLNLTNNGLTLKSLEDISSLVLLWKVEKVLISCNSICQYDLSHKISTMAKREIYMNCLFQIEVTNACRSIIIRNHSNCKEYLSKLLTFEKATFGKMISNNLVNCQQILRSSTIGPPLPQSYNTSSIALPDIPQENIKVINTVTVGKHDMLPYSFNKGMIPFEKFLYVTQEVQFVAPFKNFHLINSNITAEIASDISATIKSGKKLESIELVRNNIEEEDIIKIITALQSTFSLLHFCVSNNVVSNLSAQSVSLAISCNISLEHFDLSHCELKEQGMLNIIRSLMTIKSLKHCNLSGNCITNICAKELSSVILNNIMVLSHFSVASCKLQADGLFFIVSALEKVSTLTYLDLSCNRISNNSAHVISHLVDKNMNLNHVDFSKCMLKEKGLKEISKSLSKLPLLNYIDLSFNEISDQIAHFIAPAFKHASNVFLNNCNLQRAGIKKISSVLLEMTSSVIKLSINETFLTSPAIKSIETMLTRNLNISHFSIAACGLQEDDFQPILEALEKSSYIKYLDISDNSFDIATCRNLGERILRLSKLQHLQASSCYFEEDGLKCIFEGLQNKRNLFYFNSSSNHISSHAAIQLASAITNTHTIKHLILHHCGLQEQGLIAISNALRHIVCLRTLNLSYNNLSNKAACVLGEIIALNHIFNHLEMVSCKLTEQGLIAVANSLTKISSLTHLNISHNSITDTAAGRVAAALLANTSMQHLNLSYCSLDENGLNLLCKSLSTICKLKYLNLSDNKINNSVAGQLTSALQKISTLNHLMLCNCEIQELGFDMILGTLCGKNVLHHLNVNQNIISDQTAAKICDVIAGSSFLTKLEISSCNISGHGLRLIAESLLKDNKISLEHLNISSNTIFSNAAESISNTFQANTSLEYLDLSCCKLSGREFMKICQSLNNNILLTYFNVSHNDITEQVAAEIASIITGNVTLQYVNFQNCNLQDSGVMCITDALCNVKTLRTFIASGNPAISHESVKCITNIITSNTFLKHFDLSNCNLQELSTSMISQAAKNITTLKCLLLDQYSQFTNGEE